MHLMPSTLQKRFLVGLLLIVILASTFFSLMLRNHMKELFLSEAHSKASLMVAHTEAIQHYVRSVLRPVVADLVDIDGFIIEAMSTSYVTRQILSNLNFDEDFTYRRVAVNARNPESEMNASERAYLEKFLASPNTERIEESYILNGREHLLIARPVLFNDSCMRCHGDPTDAPAVLLDMYGAERGFWRQPDLLAGLDIISVPMESANSAISKSITLFAVCSLAGMLLLLLSVQGFFNRLVIHNLRRVGHILHKNFFRGQENDVLESLHQEMDIEDMIRSIEIVAADLSEARGQLRDHARNLEEKVQERTAELEAAVQRRSADVRLFMRLLADLNRGQDKPALLQTSLRLIAGHFAADRVVYVCGLSGISYAEWPKEEPDKEIDPDLMHELLEQLRLDTPVIREDAWFIPVQSSGQTRGLLALYWTRSKQPPSYPFLAPESTPAHEEADGHKNAYFYLALALARQLGIALDNLDSLDAILRQNTLLDSVVEGVTEPLLLLDRNGIPILANSSAQALAKALPDCTGTVQSVSGGLSELGELVAVFELGEEGNPKKSPLQKEMVFPSGRSFAVGVHRLSASGGNDMRSVVHIRETTEEKRLLAHIRQSEKLAALGQLAAGLAHEINNPLGVIQCYAELIRETELQDQTREDLDIILRHVGHARTVLRDMLDFSRSREAKPGPCDITALLATLLEIFRPQCRGAKIALELDLPEEGLPSLCMDKGLLEQVIVNLLLNAVDSVQSARTPGEGRITLRATLSEDATHIEIDVIDNGQGIPEHVLPKIFDPFFTTKEPGKGTGLGLSIAFGIVNDLGGRLEVKSIATTHGPDKHGTTFRLTFPLP